MLKKLKKSYLLLSFLLCFHAQGSIVNIKMDSCKLNYTLDKQGMFCAKLALNEFEDDDKASTLGYYEVQKSCRDYSDYMNPMAILADGMYNIKIEEDKYSLKFDESYLTKCMKVKDTLSNDLYPLASACVRGVLRMADIDFSVKSSIFGRFSSVFDDEDLVLDEDIFWFLITNKDYQTALKLFYYYYIVSYDAEIWKGDQKIYDKSSPEMDEMKNVIEEIKQNRYFLTYLESKRNAAESRNYDETETISYYEGKERLLDSVEKINVSLPTYLEWVKNRSFSSIQCEDIE